MPKEFLGEILSPVGEERAALATSIMDGMLTDSEHEYDFGYWIDMIRKDPSVSELEDEQLSLASCKILFQAFHAAEDIRETRKLR